MDWQTIVSIELGLLIVGGIAAYVAHRGLRRDLQKDRDARSEERGELRAWRAQVDGDLGKRRAGIEELRRETRQSHAKLETQMEDGFKDLHERIADMGADQRELIGELRGRKAIDGRGATE